MIKNFYKLGELELFRRHKEDEYNNHQLIDLFWETTLTCNAKCKHCGSSAENKLYTGELTTDEIKAAFKQISEDFDARKILLNVTGGEPLMRKDLFEVMEFASNLGFHWGMTTNGILLTEENIEKLRKANMETISISIDGLESAHDEFRGVPGSFDRIIENIKNIKKANFLQQLQVTTVFTKSNINELEEIYELMNSLNLTSWRVASIEPIGRAKEQEALMLEKQDYEKLFKFIMKKNKSGNLKITYGCPSFLGLKYEKDVRGYYFFCRTGINVASILYNGDLFVCPNVPRIPKLIQGNIKRDNFKEIWETKYKEFRKNERTECNSCKNCNYWDYCLGGSFHSWDLEKNEQNKCVYRILKGGKV